MYAPQLLSALRTGPMGYHLGDDIQTVSCDTEQSFHQRFTASLFYVK